jgi:hypothetical protein
MADIHALQNQITQYFVENDHHLDLDIVYDRRTEKYSLKFAGYSSWKIIRFFQLHPFWNSNKYESKSFTAAVLNAMAIDRLKNTKDNPSKYIKGLDKRVQAAAKCCLQEFDALTGDKSDVFNTLELVSFGFQLQHGDEFSEKFRNHYLQERMDAINQKAAQRVSDKRVDLVQAAKTLDQIKTTKLVFRDQTLVNGEHREGIEHNHDILIFLTECAKFLGEDRLFGIKPFVGSSTILRIKKNAGDF